MDVALMARKDEGERAITVIAAELSMLRRVLDHLTTRANVNCENIDPIADAYRAAGDGSEIISCAEPDE